jgi:transposase
MFNIPISKGTIYNSLEEAYDRLEPFEAWAKLELRSSEILHCDEPGVNVNGKRQWKHVVLNDNTALIHVHEKRSEKAIEDMEVLPFTEAALCHDCYQVYFTYEDNLHYLCGAHLVRELKGVYDGFRLSMGSYYARPIILF